MFLKGLFVILHLDYKTTNRLQSFTFLLHHEDWSMARQQQTIPVK